MNPFIELKALPRDQEKALEHFASQAHDYNSSVEKGFLKTLRNRERRMVLEFAGIRAGLQGSMIDVGCGGGFYALAAKQAGMRVCAMDAVSGMVERLRDRVDQVRIGDVESFVTEECYDLVVCAGVLDFVPHPSQAFNHLCRLVCPQGKLVILVPRAGIRGFIYRVEKCFFGIQVNCFSVEWLKAQAQQNAFTLARVGFPLPMNLVAEFEKRCSPPFGPASYYE